VGEFTLIVCNPFLPQIHTGHNADDIAESVLLNFLRGDISRLGRCVAIITGEDGPLPRCKPFKYTYEKEMYVEWLYGRALVCVCVCVCICVWTHYNDLCLSLKESPFRSVKR
jgi:hypothetical protein